jgi:predicted metal-dependent peptidase
MMMKKKTSNQSTEDSKSNDRFSPSQLEKKYDEFLKSLEGDDVRKEFLISHGIKKFIQSVTISQKDAFLSNFLINMTFEANLDIPTAGVCLNPNTGTFSIKYNPIFVAFFSQFGENSGGEHLDFNNFLLYHEVKHIALAFFQKLDFVESLVSKEVLEGFDKNTLHKLKNIAHDLSINSSLLDIMCPFFKNDERNRIGHYPGAGSFKEYPPHLSMEEYFIRMTKDEELKDKMKSNSNFFDFDSHEFMEQLEALPQEQREIIKNELREQINNALNKSVAAGNQSNDVLRSLAKLIAAPSLDVESVLSFFVEKSLYTRRKPSMKKINKKVPYVFPGKNKEKTSHLALAVDQSGSVDDDLLTRLLKTCEKFLDHTSIDIIPFDCGDIEPSKIRNMKKGDKIILERVLSGGTNFNKPTDYVNNSDTYDGLIIFTDLGADMPGPCSVERMWVTSEDFKNAGIESSGETILKFPR